MELHPGPDRFAGPLAEVMLLGLTIVVLWGVAQNKQLKWGVFHTEKGATL